MSIEFFDEPKSLFERLSEPTRRWKNGDVLFGENEFVLVAKVVTDDPAKVGTLGFHGPDQICVEYITAEQAKPWNED